jgi:small redox-active disulfide protein 2
MSLLGIIKKGFCTDKKSCCCADSSTTKSNIIKSVSNSPLVELKVLGGGCAKCNALEQATIEAANELKLNYNIVHITDFDKIVSMGVMSTPALAVGDKIVSFGKVLSKNEVLTILTKELS